MDKSPCWIQHSQPILPQVVYWPGNQNPAFHEMSSCSLDCETKWSVWIENHLIAATLVFVTKALISAIAFENSAYLAYLPQCSYKASHQRTIVLCL